MCIPGHCCFMEIVAMKDNNSSLLPSGYCLALYNQCVHNLHRTNSPLHSSIKSPHPQAHLLSPTLTKQLYFSGCCSSKYSACVCRSDLYWSSSKIMLSGALRLLLTCFEPKRGGLRPEWEVLLWTSDPHHNILLLTFSCCGKHASCVQDLATDFQQQK